MASWGSDSDFGVSMERRRNGTVDGGAVQEGSISPPRLVTKHLRIEDGTPLAHFSHTKPLKNSFNQGRSGYPYRALKPFPPYTQYIALGYACVKE
jgi:hypothetical protein